MRDLGASVPMAFPFFPSSVYRLEDLDAVDRISEGTEAGFIYARDGHPNAYQLSDELCQLEGTVSGIICSSGMSAISALLLSLVKQGDKILASNMLYGRTTQLLMNELPRFGIETKLINTCNLDEARDALTASKPRVLLVETLSNPLLRLADIPQLATLADQHNCYLIVDNTFATPVLCRPAELGADFVVESLTKMISGHSDVTQGWIGIGPGVANADEWQAQLKQVVSIWGMNGSPFDCWLTQRSFPTLALRMTTSCDNAMSLASWLSDQPNVTRVAYPGLPAHPDHARCGELLSGRYGNLLAFELAGGRDAVNTLMRAVPEIPFSPSLGNLTTTWSHPVSTSHRYDSPVQRQRQGITDGLIRVSVGIEDITKTCELLAGHL